MQQYLIKLAAVSEDGKHNALMEYDYAFAVPHAGSVTPASLHSHE